MMNCEQTRQYYRASQIGVADINHQQSFVEHSSACVSCQAFISVEEAMITALNNYPAEPAPERLLNNAMQQIAINQKLKRYKTTNIGFGLALAASLYVALVMPGQFNILSDDDTLSTITMSMNTQRTVNIVFDSPESVNNAVITLILPDNVSLAGYEDKRQLQWNAKLNAGENTLKLPLVANSTGTGLLQSTLEINGKSKKITLLVDVSSDKISTSIINTATT